MVWRFISRFLMNERVVDKLADWYPIRRTAQWVVYFINRSRAVEDNKFFAPVNQITLKKLSEQLETTLKKVKENLEKKAKKY